jgi:hypothetical protein
MDGGRRRERPQGANEGAGERHRMHEGQRQRGGEAQTGVHAARGHGPAEASPGRRVAQRDERQQQVERRRRPGHGPQRHDQIPAEILLEQRGGGERAQHRHQQGAQDPSDANAVPLPGHRYTACNSRRLFFA